MSRSGSVDVIPSIWVRKRNFVWPDPDHWAVRAVWDLKVLHERAPEDGGDVVEAGGGPETGTGNGGEGVDCNVIEDFQYRVL